MTLEGWIIMLLSIGSVTGLFGWCMCKLLNAKDKTKVHGLAEETPDEEIS